MDLLRALLRTLLLYKMLKYLLRIFDVLRNLTHPHILPHSSCELVEWYLAEKVFFKLNFPGIRMPTPYGAVCSRVSP